MIHPLESLRFFFRVDFPYLVFLLSGGHCLLTVAKDVDEFVVLGSTLDDSPGECLDKVKTTTSMLLKTSHQVSLCLLCCL